jgi:uncharacterized protein (DUF885 family)
MNKPFGILLLLLAMLAARTSLQAQEVDTSQSEMRPLIERYSSDRSILNRSAASSLSSKRHARMREFYDGWLETIAKLDFDEMSLDGRVDYLLFRNQLEYEQRQIDKQISDLEDTQPLLEFAPTIVEFAETRREMETFDPREAAEMLTGIAGQIEDTQNLLRNDGGEVTEEFPKTIVNRAAGTTDSLRNLLENWFEFYNDYDPVFTWWTEAPYRDVDTALEKYAEFLREEIVGIDEDNASDIIGDPIGREGLMIELAREMIPYTPEELIALANAEYAWCEAELIRASRELGFGDDWLAAIEHVKNLYVEPGEQPGLIRDLAQEAIEFVEERDLVTIPDLARDTWRMQMMSPERQRVSPFFTGGEVISVSFPTSGMAHDQKMMSMRGNNIHFSRATVHHELIPGHHLQGFMAARFKPYRAAFRTPFGIEGWALYWEMLLWDLNFAQTAEDRIGMLFWRTHRAARIIFSLSFHLGQMAPEEAIDYLVERVGHERDNAIAEVRRSFGGEYDPLYQAAYLLGGLQLRALHEELVATGTMTNREFHDAVLKENSIPIEMVRASLTRQELASDFTSSWKFYESEPRRQD